MARSTQAHGAADEQTACPRWAHQALLQRLVGLERRLMGTNICRTEAAKKSKAEFAYSPELMELFLTMLGCTITVLKMHFWERCKEILLSEKLLI